MLERDSAHPCPGPSRHPPCLGAQTTRGNAVLGSAVSHSLSGYIGYSRGGSSPAIPGVRGLGVWGEGGALGLNIDHSGGRRREGGRSDVGKSTL